MAGILKRGIGEMLYEDYAPNEFAKDPSLFGKVATIAWREATGGVSADQFHLARLQHNFAYGVRTVIDAGRESLPELVTNSHVSTHAHRLILDGHIKMPIDYIVEMQRLLGVVFAWSELTSGIPLHVNQIESDGAYVEPLIYGPQMVRNRSLTIPSAIRKLTHLDEGLEIAIFPSPGNHRIICVTAMSQAPASVRQKIYTQPHGVRKIYRGGVVRIPQADAEAAGLAEGVAFFYIAPGSRGTVCMATKETLDEVRQQAALAVESAGESAGMRDGEQPEGRPAGIEYPENGGQETSKEPTQAVLVLQHFQEAADKELVRLASLGWHRQQIATELGITGNSVTQAAKRLDVTIKRKTHPPRPISREVLERRVKVHEMRSQGKTVKEVAESLGVKAMTVYKDLGAVTPAAIGAAAGSVTPESARTSTDEESMEALIEAGYDVHWIAEKHQVETATVLQLAGQMPIGLLSQHQARRRYDLVRTLAGLGWTEKDIAKAVGYNEESVRKIKRALGIPLARNKIQEAADQELIRLASLGWHRENIATELGVAADTVTQAAKRLGVTIARKVPPPRPLSQTVIERQAKVVEMRRQGKTLEGIGQSLAISLTTVKMDLRTYEAPQEPRG